MCVQVRSAFSLSPISLGTGFAERAPLTHAVANASPLFDRLAVYLAGEGFFGHPGEVGVPRNSTQIEAAVNS